MLFWTITFYKNSNNFSKYEKHNAAKEALATEVVVVEVVDPLPP